MLLRNTLSLTTMAPTLNVTSRHVVISTLKCVSHDVVIQAFQYDNNDINTKYCVLQMMHEDMDTAEGQKTLTVKTNQETRSAATAQYSFMGGRLP